MNNANGKKWYVVYTRPRWEKRVAQDLEGAEIEYYCPMTRIEKQWSDRKKKVTEPLFKGYVFIRLEKPSIKDLVAITGILNFVHWLGKPAVVNNKDILTIRKFLNEFDEVQLEDSQQVFQPNDRVWVRTGVMMDYNGMVLEVKGSKVKVLLQSMGASLVAEFKKKDLDKNPNIR